VTRRVQRERTYCDERQEQPRASHHLDRTFGLDRTDGRRCDG
jgi:hypothetical protein